MLAVQGVGRLGSLFVIRNRFCKLLGLSPQIIIRKPTRHASLFRFDLIFCDCCIYNPPCLHATSGSFQTNNCFAQIIVHSSAKLFWPYCRCRFERALERISFTTLFGNVHCLLIEIPIPKSKFYTHQLQVAFGSNLMGQLKG